MNTTSQIETLNSVGLSFSLFLLLYFILGLIMTIVAIKLNNSKKTFNSIGLENKKIFQEFMALSFALPFVAGFIITYRYLTYYYVQTYAITSYNNSKLSA